MLALKARNADGFSCPLHTMTPGTWDLTSLALYRVFESACRLQTSLASELIAQTDIGKSCSCHRGKLSCASLRSCYHQYPTIKLPMRNPQTLHPTHPKLSQLTEDDFLFRRLVEARPSKLKASG